MRILSVLAITLFVSACSSTVYKDQATQLGASATALAGAFPSQGTLQSEGNAVLDYNTDVIMLGGPLVYPSRTCGDDATQSYTAFLNSVGTDQATQDSAFAALLRTSACGASVNSAPLVPATTNAAADPAQAATQQRKDAVADATAAKGKSSPPPAQPVCKAASCTLEDYTSQLKNYGDAIVAASTAQDVTDAQNALGKADSAVDGLLKAAKASPIAAPVADAISALGKLAIQDAQYAAMKQAVEKFDQEWPQIAPAVEAAARVRQALLINYRADASQVTVLSAMQYVNDDRFYHSPAERLQLFDIWDGKVSTAASSLKSAEIDPGAAVAAFTKANHTLALAMQDPSRQFSTLQADLQAVEDQVTAIQKASAPAPKK